MVEVTRRQFIKGLFGAGVLVASSGGLLSLAACSNSDGDDALLEAIQKAAPDAVVRSIAPTVEQVVSGYDFSDTPPENYFTLGHTFDLPLGSLIYQDHENLACVIAPGEASNVLTRIAQLDTTTGSLATLVAKATDDAKGYVIYDARANDRALVWVESDMTAGNWNLYAAPLDGVQVGTSTLLDSGTVTYDPPTLCVSGTHVYWTVMPDPNGPASMEDSYLKAADVDGRSESVARVVYTSHGRMITNPQSSGGIITIVPRVDTEVVRYQLTAIEESSDKPIAISLLPSGLRVSDCIYMNNTFSFCIEGNYTFAQGLKLFGTYEDLGSVDAETVFHVNKVPVSPPIFANGCLVVKSTMNIVGFDVDQQASFIIEKPNDCANYGDLLTACGSQNQLIVYTTIVNKSNAERSIVRVRVYNAV